jgi:hypothetical protein
MGTSSYQLRRKQYRYDTKASHATRDITSDGSPYSPQHQWGSDAMFKGHRTMKVITLQDLECLAPVG